MLRDLRIAVSILRDAGMTDSSARITATRSQRWYRRLLEYSLQDLIVLSLPYTILLVVVGIGACFIYDSSMRILLYSALPERYQGWLTFMALFVEEIRMLLMCASVGVPVLQLQVLSFAKVNAYLEGILNSAILNRYYMSCHNY